MGIFGCFFGHSQKPRCVAVSHSRYETVYGRGTDCTDATFRCDACGDVWVTELADAGHLTVDQVNGVVPHGTKE